MIRGPAGRGIALALCGTILLASSGCITAESRAKGNRAVIREGMTKAEVQDRLGKPDEVFPVPGQGGDPLLPVEMWRYRYLTTFWGVVVMVIFFPFGMALVQWKHYRFDVGFGADGLVRRTTDVVIDR